jgi:uncharacterized protein (TIGR02466 family)
MELAMSNEVTTQQETDMDAKNTIFYNPVFPIMTASINLDLPVEDMASGIYQLASDIKNYEGGYTTFHNGQSIDHIRGIPELKEAIYGVVMSFTRELKVEVNPNKCSIQLWASVIRRDGHHGVHHHPRSMYSGTFYVNVNENSSPLVLMNPTMQMRVHDPVPSRPQDLGPFTSESLAIKPKNNQLILWPSWLMHHVPVHTDSAPRVAISFNVDFAPNGA